MPDLPLFPNPADVIADEAARFRALSSADRARAFIEVLEVGRKQLERSPRRAEIERQILESELAWQEAHRRIIEKHGR